MKITVTNASSKIGDLMTDAQKAFATQVGAQKILALKVNETSKTIYIENGDVSTTTDGMPRTSVDGVFPLQIEELHTYSVIGSNATVDVRLVAM